MQRRLGFHLIVLLSMLLLALQPAYANGGHVHLGGVFFLLLGGIVFIGGLAVVFYLLFRSEPESDTEAPSEADADE